jgi:hypothetical protein
MKLAMGRVSVFLAIDPAMVMVAPNSPTALAQDRIAAPPGTRSSGVPESYPQATRFSAEVEKNKITNNPINHARCGVLSTNRPSPLFQLPQPGQCRLR